MALNLVVIVARQATIVVDVAATAAAAANFSSRQWR